MSAGDKANQTSAEEKKISGRISAGYFRRSKSFAEFSAEAENRVRTVFGRGVYVDENTSQAASVEFVCHINGDPIKRERALWGAESPGHRWNFLLAGNGALCLEYRRYARSRLQNPGGKCRRTFSPSLNTRQNICRVFGIISDRRGNVSAGDALRRTSAVCPRAWVLPGRSPGSGRHPALPEQPLLPRTPRLRR